MGHVEQLRKASVLDQVGQRRLANLFLSEELDQGAIRLLDLCVPGVRCIFIHVAVGGPKRSPDVVLCSAMVITETSILRWCWGASGV